MKVKDLIGELQGLIASGKVTGESQVIVSRDPEGNGFRPLDEVGLGRYDGEETWPFRTEPDGFYSEEDLKPEAPPVIVIWP